MKNRSYLFWFVVWLIPLYSWSVGLPPHTSEAEESQIKGIAIVTKVGKKIPTAMVSFKFEKSFGKKR
jgi:hypothetical protein